MCCARFQAQRSRSSIVFLPPKFSEDEVHSHHPDTGQLGYQAPDTRLIVLPILRTPTSSLTLMREAFVCTRSAFLNKPLSLSLSLFMLFR